MVIRVGKRLSRIMFCNEKLVDLFLLIPRAPLHRICKTININYSHALKILNIWASLDLLVKNKAGNRYNIFYTPKGKRISEELEVLKKLLRRNKIQWYEDD
jgi:predicted transcriptional regulator